MDFFWFWYSTKPFQINIDIKTKKTLWKVTLNLKQPDTRKTEKNLYHATKSAEFGTVPCHITLPNAWEFFLPPSETVFREACNHYVSSKSNGINLRFNSPPGVFRETFKEKKNFKKIYAKNPRF